jgi:hypothetical protein
VESLRGAPEVELLGDGDEGRELSQLHGLMIGVASHRHRDRDLIGSSPEA